MIGDEYETLLQYVNKSNLPEFLDGELEDDVYINDCSNLKQRNKKQEQESSQEE